MAITFSTVKRMGMMIKIKNALSVVVLILCMAMLFGCGASATERGEGPVSDKELIEALLKDDDLEFWATANAPAPYTQERFQGLCERCPDLDALMERDSGVESLKKYGPDLIRQYHESDQAQLRLNAEIFADVIGYVCPESAADMEALVAELSEG